MSDSLDKLAILRREDHFRDWQSLDDKRVCVLCGRDFTGREIIVQDKDGVIELNCPTLGCRSHTHQWIYPGKPPVDEKADADWWEALGTQEQEQPV